MLDEVLLNEDAAAAGFRVRCFDVVDSTNRIIKEAIRAGEPEGLVACALEQDAGYGRMGHDWKSPYGGLYFSLLLKPGTLHGTLPTLSHMSALALCDALSSFDADLSEALRIKWPNDVMCAHAKLAGISLEQVDVAVCVGVGVNVFQPADPKESNVGGKYVPSYLADFFHGGVPARVEPTGLSQSQKQLFEQILARFFPCFSARYAQWRDGGFESLREDYLARLNHLGQEVTVENLAGEFFATGKVVNVNEQGQLVLRDERGEYLTVSAGEVHLRIS